MYEGSRANDVFTALLRELDAAKASVGKKQAELSEAVPRLSPNGCSPRDLQTFEAKTREMNQATERYREAVRAFNAAAVRSTGTQTASEERVGSRAVNG